MKAAEDRFKKAIEPDKNPVSQGRSGPHDLFHTTDSSTRVPADQVHLSYRECVSIRSCTHRTKWNPKQTPHSDICDGVQKNI